MARTQVAIIGAGPAGMFLALLLHRAGIGAVVLETRSRGYVEQRVRAGVLEQTTVDLMHMLGIGARLEREGLVQSGINIAAGGEPFRIDLRALTGGKTVTVYGQQEVMKDLYAAAGFRGVPILFDVGDVKLHGLDSARPSVSFRREGAERQLDCEFIAGCDGFHGVSRQSLPLAALKAAQCDYPFSWLGILADVPPANAELIYASHENGFALASMRSPARSRYYLQCAVDEDPDAWPDERFWDELCVRLGPDVATQVTRGPSIEKSVAPVRSFLAEPMRHGRLFLVGDAAHIVPPIGAKGLNLAASDVLLLSEALGEFYRGGSDAVFNEFSKRALARVRAANRFSCGFLDMTHRFAGMPSRGSQLAALDNLRRSSEAQAVFAQNYVGLPLT